MSLRTLKYHEQKLLKKTDFLQWKNEDNQREIAVLRRYHIQKREDYVKYNKIVGQIRKLTAFLTKLDQRDAFRIKVTEALLEKLYSMGIIASTKSLSLAEAVNVSMICRRRLPVVMVRLKMSETLKEAVTFIEQGHVCVGPNTVTDPAFLVTRSMEDFVTWVAGSKIQRSVMKYNDKLDDYALLGN